MKLKKTFLRIILLGLLAIILVFNVSCTALPDVVQGLLLENGGGAVSVALGDVDSDGDVDAVIINVSVVITIPYTQITYSKKILLNDGNGNFTYSSNSIGADEDSLDIALGDLDGDDDLDAFVINEGSADVFFNNGYGVFTYIYQELWPLNGTNVVLGDLDGDNDLDAFVGNRVLLNDGSGYFSFTEQFLSVIPETGFEITLGADLGDLNGDGYLDIFTANQFIDADNNVAGAPNRVWLNNGSANFTDSGQSLGNDQSMGVALGDLDGDDDLDAFVANQWSGNKVLLNDGSGNFTDTNQSLSVYVCMDVALGDLDNDGDLDAYIAKFDDPNGTSSTHNIWRNDGAGNFSGVTLEECEQLSLDVSLDDLDGDDDLDAFVAIPGLSPSYKVWLNEVWPTPEEDPIIQMLQAQIAALEAQLEGYQDTMPPAGALHVADNWTSSSKSVTLTMTGYVRDELSIARDGIGGNGVSSAYLLINGQDNIPLELDAEGKFITTRTLEAGKDAVFTISLYAADTKPDTPNEGLVDEVTVRSPKAKY